MSLTTIIFGEFHVTYHEYFWIILQEKLPHAEPHIHHRQAAAEQQHNEEKPHSEQHVKSQVELKQSAPTNAVPHPVAGCFI